MEAPVLCDFVGLLEAWIKGAFQKVGFGAQMLA